MKNIILLITILLVVSCNKEQKQINGKWEVTSSYVNYTTDNSLQVFEWQGGIIKITKNSWEPLIQGNCYIYNDEIILEEPNIYNYSYIFYESTDEIKLDMRLKSDNKLKYRYFLKRL